MASKQSEQLATLYKGWIGALALNPEMPLDELRAMFEHWGDVTAEPGGVDYIETDAGGVPALWAGPKGCAQDGAACHCKRRGGISQCSTAGGFSGSVGELRGPYLLDANAVW